MKILSVIGAVAVILSVTSCTGMRSSSPYNNPPGLIEMSVYPTVYKGAPGQIELSITNKSDQTAQFGANYTIEKHTNGEWAEFERPPFAVIAIMYMLQPGQTQVYPLSLMPETVDYTPGRYRIVKAIYLDITGDSYYTAEFTIE